MKKIIALFTFTMLIDIAFGQQQVVLNPLKDNTLYETADGSTSNGAGEYLFVGRVGSTGGGAKRRALLMFDIWNNLPSHASIQSVSLSLNMSKTTSSTQTIFLYKVTADWGEGTSNAGSNEGSGAASTTGDATWRHRFYNTSMWNLAGGDFTATASDSSVVNSTGRYSWVSNPQMVADVQGWQNDPSTNFGWILIGNESTTNTSKRFDSKENATELNRPQLTVVYTTSTTSVHQMHIPNNFSLEQNYPNPFNPSTMITYQVPSAGWVSIKVYNILGVSVSTLVNQVEPPGKYSVKFNAVNLPSGIYYYTLSTGNETFTRKMMFIK